MSLVVLQENVLIKYMTFYENFKFKADHITAKKYLQQFEVKLFIVLAVTMVMAITE